MYSTAYTTAPLPGYGMPYEYMRTPPVSPQSGTHGYYSPRYSVHTATPSPRASPKMNAGGYGQEPPVYTTYSSPRATGQYSSAYSSPRYFTSPHTTPQRNAPDYVSYSERRRRSSSKGRGDRGAASAKQYPGYHYSAQYYQHQAKKASPRQAYDAFCDSGFFDGAGGADVYEDAPPPYDSQPYGAGAGAADNHFFDCYCCGGDADHYGYYDQVPIYTEADSTPRRSRARRASHSARPEQQQRPHPRDGHPPPPRRPSTAKAAAPKATEADARRCNIPAGYSLKNWDPAEEPILLLGSVFDANSLGKWIYDWTVFHFGAGEPMTDVAGELWLLLIQLSGKVKRAEECMPKIRRQESREMVDDFLESGERLWLRVGKLLKICEEYMWRAARRECGDKKPVTMGKNAGREFVGSIFGRDRELEKTEKLMTSVRLWSMRFDANCEEILRFPSA